MTFPRIPGIECAGVIAASVNAALPACTTVAAIMGEMGRNPAKTALLTERGADDVLVGTGREAFTGLAADYVLDLIGAHSALGSLHLVKPGGTVCVVGMLSYDWVIEAFEPVAMIPSGAKLTAFHSEDLTGEAGRAPLAHIVRGVEHGAYHANVDRVFTLDQIAGAHRYMEANQATGKVVIQS